MNDSKIRLDWIDAIKAFAIIGILLNHAVESYGLMPWFSNPSEYWPSFDERMANVFPKDGSFFIRVIQFLGWLGDMGPGVFIFASGLTLTLSALNKPIGIIQFYKTRALRIYPLYVSIHLIVLVVAIFYFKWDIGIAWTFLSILGLRFLNSLFWFINASWWFIWLILQLYLVFPFLINLLKKKGALSFLVITLVITILSRTAGVLGFTFTADLDKWMTGLFAGTRLFEFSFGMFIGFLIKNNNLALKKILNDPVKFPLISIVIYIVGFAASLTFVGSIFSIIFITIGLSGIFYSFYEYIIKGHLRTENFIVWIGKNSFSTFLIHQSFMNYFGTELSGYAKLTALILIVILSVIAGHYIEKIVVILFMYLQKKYFRIIDFVKMKISPISGIIIIICSSILSFLVAIGQINISRIVVLVFLFQFLYLFFYRVFVNPLKKSAYYRYYDIAIVISFFSLFFRGNWLSLFVFFIIISFSILFILKNTGHLKAVIMVLTFIVSVTIITEYYLRNYKPFETNSWGELPALQTDKETIYSLIPNKTTHLRYNNYDYTLTTNSLGFASPEISLDAKTESEIRIFITGDAFSMPEGIEYENSYSALLEKKLKDEFPGKTINVINAGVTGYGPNEVYAQIKKFIDTIDPDIIINEMFINEFLEINLTKEDRLSEIGLEKKEVKNKRIRDKLMILGNFQLAIQIPFYMRNLAGANEEYNYNKTLLNFYEKDSQFFNDSVINKLNYYLVNLKEISLKHNSKLIVIGVPGQVEVSDPKYITYFPKSVNINDTTIFDLNKPLRIIEGLCHNNDIMFINSKGVLKSHPAQPVYFEKSWHWNKEGHQVIADFLFDSLKSKSKLN